MSIEASAPKPRVRRSPEAARENILAAAEALLVEHGPQAIKLADVAKAAGVVHANVIHHFGSIAGVETALMERMIRQLADKIIAGFNEEGATPGFGAQALFDAFEAKGAARLAAWLELTGEGRRMTLVRAVVDQVVQTRLAREVVADREAAVDFILLNIILAIGVGLFGPTLSELLGRPPERARELALELIQGRISGKL
ncbi:MULTISPECIES: TetR/AcrR family transcriptional regulator [unclassified Caulobacter]|jgi:AcrR family transcriptional regulator|uniref:TetR/AcrR family transcriptional regulator n=1 Tax=unclassified Caulobacter TaxID=2648921 RepID=UPI00064753E9|nr:MULTISPECIES: TetR/AcrR family transcriptional regulator [unclassified Caulobacter]KQV56956.1 TetR family transcriptional regulator [Caulobacter sp. Root342]KQV66442.1 TetR family transcriptional regulator [Caulobacter sp. Root343]